MVHVARPRIPTSSEAGFFNSVVKAKEAMSYVHLQPTVRDYVFTMPCAQASWNIVNLIQQHLRTRKDVEKHVHTMLEYDLDFVCPSQRFVQIIDWHLEHMDIPWRIHSAHVVAKTETARLILRKIGLVDLTSESNNILDYEKHLYRVMGIYAKQYNEPYISASSNVAIYRLPDNKGFYWLFTRYFTMWEYSDAFPHVGWQKVEIKT